VSPSTLAYGDLGRATNHSAGRDSQLRIELPMSTSRRGQEKTNDQKNSYCSCCIICSQCAFCRQQTCHPYDKMELEKSSGTAKISDGKVVMVVKSRST